jgi:hypothetical protein
MEIINKILLLWYHLDMVSEISKRINSKSPLDSYAVTYAVTQSESISPL